LGGCMETIHCETLDELQAALGAVAPDALFRGQTREHLREDGGPDLRTSFDRHGCVPDRMLKWWHYSRAILATYIKAFDGETDLATDQAILQHYGWRSAFLDATANPAVGAWFAANAYHTAPCGELIEDCWEDPLFVTRQRAWYEPAVGRGCLYVFSRKALRARALHAVDLVEIATQDGRHRCAAQAAFMIGPLRGNLPDDCVRGRIFAPTATFAAYAAQWPELTQENLFPAPRTDPVMAALLSIPWVKRELNGEGMGIDFFDRGLPLPEYEVNNLRRAGPYSAFYRRFWLADAATPGSRFGATTFFLTEETLFHGTTTGTLQFPRLTELVRNKMSVAVELDGLVRHPGGRAGSQYGKGIYLEAQDDGNILLTELAAEHPGARPAGFGITRGMYYRPDREGAWRRLEHPEQCDCGRLAHHAHHLTVAEHFEHALVEGEFKPVRDRVYATADVDPLSDPLSLGWMEHGDS